MRNSSEKAILPTRRGPARPAPGKRGSVAKRLSSLAVSFAALVLLAACQTAPLQPEPEPEALPEFNMELELAHLDLPVNEDHRVRFLPPLARGMPAGDFVSDLDLEIRFFNVNPSTSQASGTTLGSTLSTARRTIVNRRDTYSTIWLAFSMLFERKAGEHLRAEIRLPGGPNAPVCNQASEQCLGYLDIYMFKGLWLGRQRVPEGFVPVPALLGILPISFKVLAEQAPPADNPAPDTIDDLQGVSGGQMDVALGNCPSSYLARPGQGLQLVGAGLQMVGALGGLYQGPVSGLTQPLVKPVDIGNELFTQLDPHHTAQWNAVLFVVDDFSAGYTLPSGLFDSNADVADYADQISHGALVLHQLLQMAPRMLPHTNGDVYSGYGPGGQPYYAFDAGKADPYSPHHRVKLYIQTVNVGANDTDAIPDLIRDAMWAYGGAETGFNAYSMAVNMSFAIVPCAVLDDYRNAQGLSTFEEYVAALANVNAIGEQYLSDLNELISTPVGDDPLLAYLECPLPAVANGMAVCDGSGPDYYDWGPFDTLHQVAAAGNYGNSYALYPAASAYAVSVGSLGAGAGDVLASYSNAAEIAATGGPYELSSSGGQAIAFAGTSFAAPVVSLYLAVDSMSNAYRCAGRNVNVADAYPSLAHGEYDDPQRFYVPGLGGDDVEGPLADLCIRPH